MSHYPAFSGLQTFILFVGYPRSGHSLLGAILDAHPQAIVSHELDAIDQLKKGATQLELYQAIVDQAQAFKAEGRKWMGYSYQIPGTEQGWSEQLTHIGDKRGGTTARHLENDWSMLEKIQSWGLNLKIIHLTRNPFDCISTSIRKREANQGHSFSNAEVRRKINHFFRKAKSVHGLIQSGQYKVYTLTHEKMIGDFHAEMTSLLQFLGLPPLPDYLAACERAIWSGPNKSRNTSPHWSAENRAYVQEQMSEFPFFSQYTFDQ